MSEDQTSCIRCGHSSNKKNRYCVICGAPLINQCTCHGGLLNDPCDHVNSKDAAFCSKCGSYTAFYKAGLLSTEYDENKILEEDDMEEFNDIQQLNYPFFR